MSRRGLHLRPLAVLVAAVVMAVGIADARAAGSTYHVLKCHPSYRPADELSQVGEHASFERVNECGDSFADPKLGIYNDGAAGNTAFEQFMYAAPPNTVIRSVCLKHKLRRQNHHRAEIFAWPGFNTLVAGGEGPSGWTPQCFGGLNHQQIVIRLACSEPGGCAAGPNAHAYVRDVDIELADMSDPTISHVSGTLIESGWARGVESVEVDGADAGAGMSFVSVQVNGVELTRRIGGCHGWPIAWPYAAALIPCPGLIGQLYATPDTARWPFVNGTNTVDVIASDFPGNSVSNTRKVRVDNAGPETAFENSQDVDDPELVRAAVNDVHSGVTTAQILYRRVGAGAWLPLETTIEAGEARARVDSSAVSPGDYEFKADVSDRAGNTSASTLRRNGTPMRLRFPLRFGSGLQARLGPGASGLQTVPYGTSTPVRGRLVDEGGEPLAGKEVLVVEKFGDGALIRERSTYAVTDLNGRFQTKVPAGPSRRIVARFAGTQKYLPVDEPAGTLDVRSRASFVTSRDELKEGQRVAFAGKVAHRGAHIPAGGKLIELQVQLKPGRWDTVREAFRTDASGRYRLGYRFGRHYVSDAKFLFRVKVQTEGDWPFEGGASARRKVIVRAR